jgi:hypothetical protein
VEQHADAAKMWKAGLPGVVFVSQDAIEAVRKRSMGFGVHASEASSFQRRLESSSLKSLLEAWTSYPVKMYNFNEMGRIMKSMLPLGWLFTTMRTGNVNSKMLSFHTAPILCYNKIVRMFELEILCNQVPF